MSLADRLKDVKVNLKPTATGPAWEGPAGEGPNGGITFSLLSRFLVCRERFRILTVEGLKAREGFSHRLEYGNMWHVCEESAASEVKHFDGELNGVDTRLWEKQLESYVNKLLVRFPLSQEKVLNWWEVCKAQFPLYVRHWAKHPDIKDRTPLLQEHEFSVFYQLPSGRSVRLRGKLDSVDLVDDGIWLQENKTKGDVDEVKIQRQLAFDLQTMLYLVALEQGSANLPTGAVGKRLMGVRYNVVRRPLSGGKGTIVRREATPSATCGNCNGTGRTPKMGKLCSKCSGLGRSMGKPEESKEAYYERVAKYIQDEPEHYFMRFKVAVSQVDLLRFRQRCLDPILEQLCDWWEWVTKEGSPWGRKSMKIQGVKEPIDMPNAVHWQFPFGVWNPLLDGDQTDMDDCVMTGSRMGLDRVETLFPELDATQT